MRLQMRIFVSPVIHVCTQVSTCAQMGTSVDYRHTVSTNFAIPCKFQGLALGKGVKTQEVQLSKITNIVFLANIENMMLNFFKVESSF